ncbi:MAG: acyl-CoA thioesterase [Dehalobacterium sp.]
MDNTKKRKQLTMTLVTQPNQANFAGNVHGGEIMKLMDSAAGAVAYRYAKCSVVTARVDELQFHLPIHVGALVTCTATIAYVGTSSMEVIVTVDTENLKYDNPPQRALSAYFTMVALDKDGKPQKVPSLEIYTEEEKMLYEEGERRHKERKLARKMRS